MKFKYIGIICFISILISACSDDFLDSRPRNAVTTAAYYANETDFINSTNGIYNAFTYYRQQLEYFPWIDMATPAAVAGAARFGMFHWGNMNLTPTNYHGDQVRWYGNWWIGVNRANEVLKRIAENGNVITTPGLKDRLKGEALYLRAQFYFFLTYIYGDVPLLTEPYSPENVYPERAPHATVVEQMITDLKEAELLLPSVKTYRNTANLGRASKGAAMSLLGKIYCFEKRWAEAEVELKKVIDSGDYALTPGPTGFNDQFWPAGENGIESIFEIQYKSGEGDNLGNAYVTFTAIGGTGIDAAGGGNNYVRPTEWLTDKYETKNGYNVTSTWMKKVGLADSFAFTSADPAFDPMNSFNNRDPRLMWTVMYEGSPYLATKFPGNTYKAGVGGRADESNYATVKYIVRQTTQLQSDMNMIVLRYADVLLLYAEALMEQNKLAEAVPYVNLVRQRPSVNMPVVPDSIATDQTLLRNYIRDERVRELALEYGHIFFDLRRWGTYGQEMRNYWTAGKHGRTANSAINFRDDRDYLWPIPQSELDKNPNMTQNPGY